MEGEKAKLLPRFHPGQRAIKETTRVIRLPRIIQAVVHLCRKKGKPERADLFQASHNTPAAVVCEECDTLFIWDEAEEKEK